MINYIITQRSSVIHSYVLLYLSITLSYPLCVQLVGMVKILKTYFIGNLFLVGISFICCRILPNVSKKAPSQKFLRKPPHPSSSGFILIFSKSNPPLTILDPLLISHHFLRSLRDPFSLLCVQEWS
jgi:hypothetical protein